jgi:hypothetical protein
MPEYADQPLRELTPSAQSSGTVTAHFKDLRRELIASIHKYPIVVGCVAWLTDVEICRALSTREHASIVIQKEDFLRPDAGDVSGVDALLKKYQKTYGLIGRRNWERHMFPEPLCQMSYLGDPMLEGVRCVGIKRRGGWTKPLMHHKFAVFCDAVHFDDAPSVPIPHAVWTGSYNWSGNAENGFENAVFIEDEKIAWAYFNEWMLVTSISEPLDWKHEYVAPEWRVGS